MALCKAKYARIFIAIACIHFLRLYCTGAQDALLMRQISLPYGGQVQARDRVIFLLKKNVLPAELQTNPEISLAGLPPESCSRQNNQALLDLIRQELEQARTRIERARRVCPDDAVITHNFRIIWGPH